MADSTELLAQGIFDRFEDLRGPVVLIGQLRVAVELSRLLAQAGALPAIASTEKVKRLRRIEAAPTVIRARADQLPLGQASLKGVVAIQAVGRSVDQARAAIGYWRTALTPGGRLFLADALSWSPTVRVLTRARLAPEDLTGLLLNAGFGQIRQTWTRPRRGVVITTGRLLGL